MSSSGHDFRKFVQDRELGPILREIADSVKTANQADASKWGLRITAPFRKPDGHAYIEPHHTTRLADDGPDHPAKVIGLCPNCHRRAHYAEDAKVFNHSLKRKLSRLEAPK